MKSIPSRFRRGCIVITSSFMVTVGIVWGVMLYNSYQGFSARFPDATTMNITHDVPFDDVSTRSLLTVTACIQNKVLPHKGYEPPYVDGRLIAIHIMPSTLIFDQRGRQVPVQADARIFRPGQAIHVQTAKFPIFAGNAIAKEIIVYADNAPEPCEPSWVKPPHP